MQRVLGFLGPGLLEVSNKSCETSPAAGRGCDTHGALLRFRGFTNPPKPLCVVMDLTSLPLILAGSASVNW